MEYIDPGCIDQRLVVESGYDPREQVANGGRAWQGMRKYLYRAFGFNTRLGDCQESACLSGALYGCTY